MAKTNLASMSVDALLRMRDEIASVLGRKANELKQQLSRLAGQPAESGKGRRGARKACADDKDVGPDLAQCRHSVM